MVVAKYIHKFINTSYKLVNSKKKEKKTTIVNRRDRSGTWKNERDKVKVMMKESPRNAKN